MNNEYILGNFFGFSQVIIGYPFDTVKTYIQNSKTIKPLFYKPTLFYKGVQYPLITTMLGTTMMFGNYSYFQDLFNNKFLSASITGIIGSFLITPLDYLKIHRQIYGYNSLKDKKIINALNLNKSKNLMKNINILYRGLTLTILRESLAIPAYFLTFDYMYNQYNIHPFLSGGVAGINSWFFTYPLDTLKTRRQLYHTKTLKELISLGSLYNGLGITLLRGFIVNGTSFYFYSMIKKSYSRE